MQAEPKPKSPAREDPVFNTFRRKPLRPFYSLLEFKIGLGILFLLAGITEWVLWRGAHPDPQLFGGSENLLTNKGKDIPIYKRPMEPWTEPGSAAPVRPKLEPFPDSVISDGWHVTGPPQVFDDTSLYIKIDGRETFYKSFGFQKLYCLTLAATQPGGLTVDIELFDLGNIENALGAFSAEISNPDKTTVALESDGFSYLTRNGGFIVRGQYYVRLIGSDDNDLIRQKIAGLKQALTTELPGGKLPWAYELLVGGLQINPGRIRYQRENAFSFGFAANVYVATVPGGETEIFIARRESETEAGEFAKKLGDGFAGFGKRLTAPAGTVLVQNEYIHTIEAVQPYKLFVIGVRMAKSTEDAVGWLVKLQTALTPAEGRREP